MQKVSMIFGVLGWMACASCALTTAVLGADEPAAGVQVRIVWGGGVRVPWQGKITISEGTLHHLRTLGLDADAPGSFHAQGQTIAIRSPSARSYDGLDVWAQAPRTAELTVELSPGDEAPPEIVRVPLSRLLREPAAQTLDDSGNSIHLQRVPGGALRVRWDSDHLVFDPSESWRLTITPTELGSPDGTPLDLFATLTRKASEDVLWRASEPLNVQGSGTQPRSVLWDIQMPMEEGIYELSLKIERAGRRAFWADDPIAERTIQLVVVDRHQRRREDRLNEWHDVAEFDPAQSRWWERLVAQVPTLPTLPGAAPRVLENPPAETVEWEGKRYTRIVAGGWQAYPLPIAHTGQPHIIDVAYPADHAQVLGVAVIEADIVGHVAHVNPETCIEVEENDIIRRGEQNLQFVVWPQTDHPYLLLSNRDPQRDALFGPIRVRYRDGALPPLSDSSEPAADVARDEPHSSARASDSHTTRRHAWAYFDRPVFPETFSAPQAKDPHHGRAGDDWETFLLGTQRLADYLQFVGYTGAAISVWSEGSTVYPVELLDATPKYDTGTYFSTGQDPARKDVLELMFRVFEREGLTLVPTLQFSGPIPELERQLRLSEEASPEGIVLLDTAGRHLPTLEGHSSSPIEPAYNPLDGRVQEEMLRVVEHLARRYGHHASFGGINIPLADGHYTHLPDATWGADRVTLQRFLDDLAANAAPGDQAQAAPKDPAHATPRAGTVADATTILQEPQRSAWVRWRVEQMTDLYRRMSEAVQSRNPRARLYLSPIDLTSSPAMRGVLGPNLLSNQSMHASLLEMGIDLNGLASVPAIVIARTQTHARLNRLPQRGPELEWNAQSALDEVGRKAAERAALFHHQPAPMRLREFDEQRPFGDKNSVTWLVPQVAPAGELNRQRLIHSLAVRDTTTFMDGGWTMLRGQPDTLRDLLDVYRRLPAAEFTTYQPAEGTTSPLTIRTHAEGDTGYIYVVNDSPWPTEAIVTLKSLTPSQIVPLSPRLPIGDVRQADQDVHWRLSLDSYAITAAMVAVPTVAIKQVQVQYSPDVIPYLRQRLTALSERVASLANPPAMDVLDNPGFEAAEIRSTPSGWEAASGPGIQCRTDTLTAHGGEQSFRITSNGPVAWMRSATFAPPTTGRIALSMWLRSDADRQPPPLRLAVEGKLDGETYYRHAPIERETGESALTSQWTQFVLRVDDLPLEGLRELRIGLDLMGPGTVWVDDVEVHDLSFTRGERIELSKVIAVAELQLSRGQVSECWQTIRRYWPRFLEEHVAIPTPTSDPPEALSAKTAGSATAKRPRNGKMLDRVRRIIPSIRR